MEEEEEEEEEEEQEEEKEEEEKKRKKALQSGKFLSPLALIRPLILGPFSLCCPTSLQKSLAVLA